MAGPASSPANSGTFCPGVVRWPSEKASGQLVMGYISFLRPPPHLTARAPWRSRAPELDCLQRSHSLANFL